MIEFPTPKRDPRSNESRAAWYRYYAGYSPSFVARTIRLLCGSRPSRVLDPWNGAGTTSQVALEEGHIAFGFDINPVMIIVAKARLLTTGIRPSHISLAENILDRGRRLASRGFLNPEPLETWFEPVSAARIRGIERALQQLLVNERSYAPLRSHVGLEVVSDLAAFFYTVLFRTMRDFLSGFRSSNPTWIRIPHRTERADATAEALQARFLFHTSELAPTHPKGSLERRRRTKIELSSSAKLPLDDKSVDVALSSPPYCTRIDYAITTSPELALLGFSVANDLGDLRARMLGTTTITKDPIVPTASWGRTCLDFLFRVHSHKSRASSTYYYRTHLQYFDGIFRSLQELDRVVAPGGACALVVQDSHYKDVHNDVPRIFIEMALGLGWELEQQFNFTVERTLAAVNRESRKYRPGGGAIESALILRLPA